MIKARLLSHLSVLALFAVPYLGSAPPALAVAENWQVGKISGHAWIDKLDGERLDLALGMEIEPGVTICTASAAKVTLLRGPESMVIGPRSIIAVSEHPTEGLSTTILEKTGTVQFDVQRENVKHFSVETPMLAAVVKGTHFTVTVGRRDGGVAVSRGTVEVTSLATGQMADVTAGQHAGVGSRGLTVGGRGQRPSITQGPPRAAVVAAVSVNQVTTFTPAELAAVATVAATETAPGPTVAAPSVATAAVAASQAVGQSANASQRNATASAPTVQSQAAAGVAASPSSFQVNAAGPTASPPGFGPASALNKSVAPGPGPGDGHGHGPGSGDGHGRGHGDDHGPGDGPTGPAAGHGPPGGQPGGPSGGPAGGPGKSDNGVGNNGTPGNGGGRGAHAGPSPGGPGPGGGRGR